MIINNPTSNFNTPILFLIFNRKDVTQQVFNQIRKLQPKHLYVVADGPRNNNAQDIVKCNETRDIINQIDWECELRTIFRDENLGCGPGVASGITWFFENVEQGIILEDDCYPDLTFFPYCEELLIKYKHSPQIKFIGGNNFQNDQKRGEGNYYFSRYPTSWGWAGWRRSWQLFNHDISSAKQNILSGKLDMIFNSYQEKRHWAKSLHVASNDTSGIWDFHFYYAIWTANGICITPNQNLVINLGFFNQATHYFLKDSTKTKPKCESMSLPLVHPTLIEINKEADKFTFDNFYSHSIKRVFRLLKENSIVSIFKYFKNKLK